jgi:hypothetical protein
MFLIAWRDFTQTAIAILKRAIDLLLNYNNGKEKHLFHSLESHFW